MQIQKVNNIQNTNFRAKLQIEGAKKDVSRKLSTLLKKEAKTIGTDKDIISISVGNKYSVDKVIYDEGQRCTYPDYYRDVNIAYYIKGKLKQHSLTADANIRSNDMMGVEEEVMDFLKILGKK